MARDSAFLFSSQLPQVLWDEDPTLHGGGVGHQEGFALSPGRGVGWEQGGGLITLRRASQNCRPWFRSAALDPHRAAESPGMFLKAGARFPGVSFPQPLWVILMGCERREQNPRPVLRPTRWSGGGSAPPGSPLGPLPFPQVTHLLEACSRPYVCRFQKNLQ